MTMPPDIDVLGVWRVAGCFSRISAVASSSAAARAAAAPAPPKPTTTRSASRSHSPAMCVLPSGRERQPGDVTEDDAWPEGGAAARIRRTEDAGHRVPCPVQSGNRSAVHPDDLRALVDHRSALGSEDARAHLVADEGRVDDR